MTISRLLFALTSSTITLWAVIGLIALATTMADKDNEKASNGQNSWISKGNVSRNQRFIFFNGLSNSICFSVL